MFELTVRRTFAAAHAIVMQGVRERVHGHNWQVVVTVQGAALDSDGLLCDFHALEATLDAAVGPFHNRSLNEVPPFDRVNPTAENVAEFVALEVGRRLPEGVLVRRVEVEEAPGCVAAYVVSAEPAKDASLVEAKPSAVLTAITAPASAARAVTPAVRSGAGSTTPRSGRR
jgi:6-pyruvoyltetrahydropterin/6-carboxytetrahydropterin synthase